jgi:transcriptional regulator with XRE-family HTH domain
MPGHVKPHKKSEHHALKLARFQLMAKAQLLNLGIAIRERREELGLSRNHLAQRFPVDPKTIERWEAGKNSGGFDNLDEVAKHLETTPQALQARAIAIARSNDSGATETQAEDRPATVTELADAEERAVVRHSEILSKLAEIERLLEPAEKQQRQVEHKGAGH